VSPRPPDDHGPAGDGAPGRGRGRRRRHPDEAGEPGDAGEAESRRRRLRAQPAAYDNELHYGESNRRRAREFLGRNENAVADRRGRRWARDPGGDPGGEPAGRRGPAHSAGGPDGPDDDRWRPDDRTGELPVTVDLLGVAPESPGIAQQPLAPWMTGEHQAVTGEHRAGAGTGTGTEPMFPVEDLQPGAPPPDWARGRGPATAPPGAPPATPREMPAPGDAGAEAVEAGAAGPTIATESNVRGSMLVAAGIFLSRSAGLLREVVIGALLGTTPAADAFKAALRIPNLMQNLLGEGVLSASFIPVYARLRAEGRHEEAGRVAGAIAGLLAAVTGVISLVGVVFAEPITAVLVPGFTGDKHDLTVQLTRIMFPGIGFLVLSAWCLGVLNSHRQFFLSYVAPVLWNVAQIAALVVGLVVVGGRATAGEQHDLAVWLSWGVLIGGVLQFGVQIRPVRRLLGTVRLNLDTGNVWVRSVIARFTPVVLGRGAVQIMGWVDLWLASYLVSGAVSSLSYTMVLYLLPVSLFGVSVAAAELPDMSQVDVHDPDTRRRFRLRLEDSMGRIAWYVAFTATMFIVVGDVVVAAILEYGNFTHGDTIAVWMALAVLSTGLLPVTASRLLQNGLYALDDPRTPARLGVLGVVLSAVVGVVFMFPLDRLTVGVDGIEGWGDALAFGPLPADVRQNVAEVPHLGIVGLALGATISRWIEYRLLSNALAWRVGRTKLAGRWLGPIAIGCAIAAGVAYFAELAFGSLPNLVTAVLVVGPAGATYTAVTHSLGVPESRATVNRLAGVRRRVSR
jgi:putative peptidoglycan lipid II flippase